MIPCEWQFRDKATLFNNAAVPLNLRGKRQLYYVKHIDSSTLPYTVIIELSPLKDVLLTHNVGVDEKIAITHTKMLLARGALEALQMVNFVPHTHRHLECADPLLARCTETILAKQPEIISPA